MELLDKSVDVPGMGHGEGGRDLLGDYCERRGFVKHQECGSHGGYNRCPLEGTPGQAHYTLLEGSQSLFHQVKVQDEYDKYLHIAKAHFPFEVFLVGDDEDSFENIRRKTFQPGISHIFKDDTSMTLETKEDTQLHFRTQVSLALNAMGMTQRKANRPADKVACCASMCNVDYDYNKDDIYSTSLHKVVTVLS
jgi:hypothetical protein